EAARLANTAAGIAVAKAGTAVVYPAELTRALHATEVMSTDAKIVTLDEAMERVALWRAWRERVGFTNGCFDLIHPGHISLI
ncbi:D-glycero-beta-D-manno-heptose 1-phosphate adenylyltransferase, partial [Streptomyces caniscabiei]